MRGRSLLSYPTPFLAFALAGCVVGPDFHQPAPLSTNAYLSASEISTAGEPPAGPATSSSEVPIRWWAAYRSPVLNALVDRAITNNRSLAASNATLARARAELAAARGTALPQIDVNGRVEHEQANLSAFGFKPGALPGLSGNPEFNLYSVGGGVS
jgi:outer membrane protein TolC